MPNSNLGQKDLAQNNNALTQRDSSLDYLRGIAVFLMIFAHSIHFFHDGSNETFRFWEGIGNTLCFTTFLFVSGAATYLAYLKDGIDWGKKKISIYKRTLYLLIGYYTIAFVVSIPSFVSNNWFSKVIEIITFSNVPGFTEFIIPFMFFSITILFLHNFYKFIAKRFSLAILAGIIMFSLGSFLFTVYVPEPLNFWKALFVGSEGVYRFPIFQYFPIFALGLWWGNTIHKSKNEETRDMKSLALGGIALFIYAVAVVITKWFNFPFIDSINRWPPSIGFLSIGVAFVAFARTIIKTVEKFKFIDPINRFFIYIGQDAFDMFLFSTLTLLVYQNAWGQKFFEWQVILILFVVLISLSILASSINSLNSPSLFRKGTDIFTPYQRLFKKRFVVLSIAMVIIVFGNLKIPVYSDVAGSMVTIKDLKGTESLNNEAEIPWWNNEYGNYSQIEVSNEGNFTSLRPDDTITLSIDHEQLINLKKSTDEGKDLQLVYLNEDEQYQTVPIKLINPNQSNTQILFNVVNKIYPAQEDNRYFLYHEDIINDEERALFSNLINTAQQSLIENTPITNYSVSIANEGLHKITTNVSHLWGIIGLKEANDIVFNAQINDPEIIDEELNYKIVGTDIQGTMSLAYPTSYQIEIPVDKLKPGAYEVVAFVDSNKNQIFSQSSYFFISEPMYVSWTIDWEGYNEKPSYLEQLTTITEDHNVPLTHFFNPRIYITESVTESQRAYMTNWIKNRRDNLGEAIGLHLHMHKDMVADAGVEPKDAPRWGSYKDADGQDVLSTEYSYDELQKIIGWGVEKFEENGLGTPKLYRAGGWFADLELLNVLNDKGFWLDSSGRKREAWWSKYTFWNLENTTQPYQISKQNQNLPEEPTMDLWEFPNNGLDTTAFEAAQLIRKFEDNYSGGVLEDKKLITYLSHPRYFNVEAARMESVLQYLENVKYENDKGPVVFITLEDAYKIWTEN